MSDASDERDPDRPAEPGHDAAQDALDALFGEHEMEESEQPPIRLDKTGALADVPKLEPRRPYERPDRPGPEDHLPPPIARVPVNERAGAPRARTPDEEVAIAGGPFLAGEEGASREIAGFRIDRYPVTNADYEAFVEATGHRPPLYWPDGRMPDELSDHPVVGVDYFDALAYARWKGKDLPYEDEWERAARGTDGRLYPWGDETEPTEANTARLGLKTTTPVPWYPMNVTPEGVHDLCGNAWEMTHSPAKGGGIVLRGGSWFDFALYSKGWFAQGSPPETRNGTIGFRLVRRPAARRDAPRAVPESDVDAAIAERRGPQPTIDPSTFNLEKRDLVPDYRRLRNMRLEREADEREAKHAALAGRPGALPERRPRPPVKATLPPPLPKRPQEAASPAGKAPAGKQGPIHVTTAPPPRPARPPERSAPVRPPAAANRIPSPEPLDDRGGRVLFGASFVLGLLLLGLLVAGFLAHEEGATRPTPEGGTSEAGLPGSGDLEPGPASRFPPPPAGDERDAAPFRILDAEDDDARAAIRTGRWLLVFADPSTADGAATVAVASSLHRALRDEPLRLALVVPRAAWSDRETGALLPEETRRAMLRDAGAKGDLPVVVDADEGARAIALRWAVGERPTALLLGNGRLLARTSAGDGPLARAALEALAARGTAGR